MNLMDVEKTWKVLEDAIHEINNHNASGLSFEELYRCPDLKTRQRNPVVQSQPETGPASMLTADCTRFGAWDQSGILESTIHK